MRGSSACKGVTEPPRRSNLEVEVRWSAMVREETPMPTALPVRWTCASKLREIQERPAALYCTVAGAVRPGTSRRGGRRGLVLLFARVCSQRVFGWRRPPQRRREQGSEPLQLPAPAQELVRRLGVDQRTDAPLALDATVQLVGLLKPGHARWTRQGQMLHCTAGALEGWGCARSQSSRQSSEWRLTREAISLAAEQ